MVPILPPHKNHRKAEENRFAKPMTTSRDVKVFTQGLRRVGLIGHDLRS